MENTTEKRSIFNILSLVAVIGPALFLIVFIVEGFVRTGYSPLKDTVSALSLGGRGWIQITSFLICGILVTLMAFCMLRLLRDSGAGKASFILLVILGISLFLSGIFVMDIAGTPANAMSPSGIMHGIFGGLIFLLMPAVLLVFLGVRRLPNWARVVTIIFGVVILFADIMFIAATRVPALIAMTLSFAGLLQRLVLVPFFIWLIILGFILYRMPENKIEII